MVGFGGGYTCRRKSTEKVGAFAGDLVSKTCIRTIVALICPAAESRTKLVRHENPGAPSNGPTAGTGTAAFGRGQPNRKLHIGGLCRLQAFVGVRPLPHEAATGDGDRDQQRAEHD